MAADDTDLAWALKALRDDSRQTSYRGAQAYYDGRHRLQFATEKFRNVFGRLFTALADNLCPAVVDSVSDRLAVTGVTAADQTVADAAWAIWQRNRMDARAAETHHEALLTGDGYALVWPNKTNEAVIWPLPACQVAVKYDPNKPGVLQRAARVWQDDDDGRVHLDLYYPDRVERYVTRGVRKQLLGPNTSYRDFVPFVDGELENAQADGQEPNPWGKVPLFHFPNRRYHAYGVSELRDVIPLQDALNKAVCDMLVAMEFSAFPQRWATGIDVGETDEEGKPVAPPFDYGVDRMFAVNDKDAKFGDFKPSDLTQYVEVQENLRSEIARVSGTPLHYLFITRGDFPSGEAMKSAEARFTRKVTNRQTSFGNQWEDLLTLALQMESDAAAKEPGLSLTWESASPLALDTGEPTPDHVKAEA